MRASTRSPCSTPARSSARPISIWICAVRSDARQVVGVSLVFGGLLHCGCVLPEIRLDLALELDRHGIAVAVLCRSCGDANPSLADAVFLDIVLLDALEADADASLQHFGIVERAVGVGGKAIRRGFGHRRHTKCGERIQWRTTDRYSMQDGPNVAGRIA